MKVLDIKKYSVQDLIDSTRRISLVKDNSLIYNDAEITVQSINPNDVLSCQSYILENCLKNIAVLSAAFKQQNIDIFNLDGFIAFNTQESKDSKIILTPPMVAQNPDTGKLLLLDGAHRTYHSLKNGTSIKVIIVSNHFHTKEEDVFKTRIHDLEMFAKKADVPLEKRNRSKKGRLYGYKDFNMPFLDIKTPTLQIDRNAPL